MARGQRSGRKPATDSVQGLLDAARRPDTSTATAPRDLPGAEKLNDVGFAFLDDLYRSRDSWTFPELTLLVTAAHAHQQIGPLQDQIEAEGHTIKTKVTVRAHPAIKIIEDLRTRISVCYRDCGLRTTDRAVTREHGVTTPGTTVPDTKPIGDVFSIETLLAVK